MYGRQQLLDMWLAASDEQRQLEGDANAFVVRALTPFESAHTNGSLHHLRIRTDALFGTPDVT
jgi:hypothetical protein